MILVASTNGMIGMPHAMDVLRGGGSAVDAVEAGIRYVEANPDDHTVGYGGYPNILGEVELDASIMDGTALAAGAVGAVQGYLHPVSIARRVMEHLPHVLLTGRGAERFAAEMGFARRDLLTEEAYRVWKRRLEEELPPEAATSSGLPHELYRWIDVASDPETPKGTVNLLAQDERSNLAAGASTSGWAWKYPGRLGDTPIIGAGIYADSRYGAAACTGLGEMAIRLSTARSLVFYLRSGSSLDEAARRAVADLEALSGPYLSRMHFVAIDNAGHHVGYTNQEGTTYAYMTPEMSEPVEAVRSFVPMRMCWGSRT